MSEFDEDFIPQGDASEAEDNLEVDFEESENPDGKSDEELQNPEGNGLVLCPR